MKGIVNDLIQVAVAKYHQINQSVTYLRLHGCRLFENKLFIFLTLADVPSTNTQESDGAEDDVR